jgi:hypothetical protein
VEASGKPSIALPSDIGADRAYAQVEAFLRGLEKPEANSIAYGRGLPSGCPV